MNRRIASLKEEKDAIAQKNIKGIIADALAKQQLDKASTKEEDLKCRLGLVTESALDIPEDLK